MSEHYVINAIAPTRICDIGGWTDTWFARRGAVLNFAVYPYVEVQIHVAQRSASPDRILLSVENFGHTYTLNPTHDSYGKHPLIEAAIEVMAFPADTTFRVNIFSDAPPGASMGTSAAVSVALIGALDALTAGRLTPHEVAALAHRIETEKLGLQCGVQDQLASAYGGLNYMDIREFPFTSVSPLQIPNNIWWELEHRLAVIYIGTPHSSSEIHRKVIDSMGENADQDDRLLGLAALATAAKNAVYEGDFVELGCVMNQNTELQRALHPALVSDPFEEIIRIAQTFDALGCKVNGAGGDGGSMTILTDGDMSKKRRLLRALDEHGFSSLPVYLSRQGLRVWRNVCGERGA